MQLLTEVFVFGSIQGALYALVAVGFTLIFGVGGIINLAHGSFYMLGAYLTYTFSGVLGFPMVAAIAAAVALTAVAGVGLDRFLLRPMRSRHEYVLIITLAAALFLQEAMYVAYGPYGKVVKTFVNGDVALAGLSIPYQKVFVFTVSLLAIVLLWLFIAHTRAGKSIAAVAQNVEGAVYVGIRPDVVLARTMGLSAALAALAGICISPLLDVTPDMWVFPLFRAFAIVIIGGLGSLAGAVVAAFLLGYVETAVSYGLSANYPDLVYLVAIIVVLFFKPEGLMGRRRA
jgi:branched-chain amino acid transport system permease protein